MPSHAGRLPALQLRFTVLLMTQIRCYNAVSSIDGIAERRMNMTNEELELMDIIRERPDLISYALRLVAEAAARTSARPPAETGTN